MHVLIHQLAPVDGADAGHAAARADAVDQQATADLPREHARVLVLVACDLVHHVAGRHLRLRAADDARLYRTSLVEPAVHADNATSGITVISRVHWCNNNR